MQKDDAQQSVFYDNTVADPKNDYTYDALYRLIKCEGREHAGSNAAVSYNDSTRIGKNPLPTDASAMRRYAQYYKYDGVGNMLQMKHTTTGGTGNWTRNFDVATTSNKLLQSSIGSNGTGTESYTYDARGNMIDGMNHLLSMEYNDENRLEKVEITASLTAYYQYDDDGQRVRKVIVNTSAATRQVRKYIDDWEVYQKIDSGTNTIILERETLHVDDQDKRIALIDTPTIDTLSTGEVQLLRYQYSNNISTASLELDENAAVITYEEYYPYGNTSYQGGRSAAECSLKRYRYTGKERDEETGLNYHGARYYAPWLARWSAVDPINIEWYNCINGHSDKNKKRQVVEFTASSFEYCYNNPVRFIDPNGEQAKAKEPDIKVTLPTIELKGKKMSFLEKFSRKIGRMIGKVIGKILQIFSKIRQAASTVMNIIKEIGKEIGTFVGLILYKLGQPIRALKEVGALGSKKGSSIASYTLSKILPWKVRYLNHVNKLLSKLAGRRIAGNVLGRFLGRLVPVLGVFLTGWDGLKAALGMKRGLEGYQKSTKNKGLIYRLPH